MVIDTDNNRIIYNIKDAVDAAKNAASESEMAKWDIKEDIEELWRNLETELETINQWKTQLNMESFCKWIIWLIILWRVW